MKSNIQYAPKQANYQAGSKIQNIYIRGRLPAIIEKFILGITQAHTVFCVVLDTLYLKDLKKVLRSYRLLF